MSFKIRRLLASAAILACLAMPQAASALSVYDVIMMSRNGYEPENIIRLIGDTGSAFTLEAMDAVRLKDAGVSDEVVAAMFAAHPATTAAEAGGEAMAGEMPPPATMADLLLLAEGRISDEVIIAFLDSRGISFNPDSTAVVRLRKAGLGETVLNHLVARTAIRPVPEPQYAAPAEPATPLTPPATAYAPPEEDEMRRYGDETGYLYPYEDEITYIYPPRYYGPSYFIGFSGLHHSMFRHRYLHAHPYPGHWFFHRKHAFFHDKQHHHGDGKDFDHDRDRHHGEWSRLGAGRSDDDDGDDRSSGRGSVSIGNSGSSRSSTGGGSGVVRSWSSREDGDSRDSGSSRSSASSGSRWNELYNSRSTGTTHWGLDSSRSRSSAGSTGSSRSRSSLESMGTTGSTSTLWGVGRSHFGSSAGGSSSGTRSSVTVSPSRGSSARSSSATESTSTSRSSRGAAGSTKSGGITRGWSGRTEGSSGSLRHNRR